MSEVELRREGHIQIGAAEALVAARGSPRRPLRIEDRQLTEATWPTHRELAARVVPAREHVGHGVARFAAEEPGGKHGVCALEEPWDHERPTRTQQRHDGLATRQGHLGERALPLRQTEVAAARRLAAHGSSLAQAEND